MIFAEPAPLVPLAAHLAAVSTLQQLLAAQGRTDEAVVLGELRALGGGHTKGTYVEPQAPLVPHTRSASAPVHVVFDGAALRSTFLPPDGPSLLFDVPAAIEGATTDSVDT